MNEIRWATFDCFGTLVDWRHGIATGAELLFPGQGTGLLEIYNTHEPVVQREKPELRYREVMAESLRRTAAEAGLALNADDTAILGQTIPYWPVFPDTTAALTALREDGWRLALLTNCDRDIIGETQRRLGVPIDAVITAEDAGAYKPDYSHFLRFQQSFGAGPENWVHIAQSYFHDITPAHELNIRRVWINRLGQTDDPGIADAVLPDLTQLVDTVNRVHEFAR
ncbi:MAG TPA: HAD family hydrolase [Pseudonocardiaceae bacterium]|jgi:2-haloacid dehalogenase|nr:HAD family hydrolase [Pseudonocardiaceae bacterium]